VDSHRPPNDLNNTPPRDSTRAKVQRVSR